jgi:hypothetical protein
MAEAAVAISAKAIAATAKPNARFMMFPQF